MWAFDMGEYARQRCARALSIVFEGADGLAPPALGQGALVGDERRRPSPQSLNFSSAHLGFR